MVSAIDLECHIGALQTLLWYREHNPDIHRDTDRRRTVNGPTMFDHLTLHSAEVIDELQMGQAFNKFTAGGKIDKCSISSLLLEAFCRSGCESVAEDARGIVIDAVSRSRDLDAMLQEVVKTGMFDREAGADDEIRLAELDGFQDFNPATAAGAQGAQESRSKRWEKR